jgi:hypothetical protein
VTNGASFLLSDVVIRVGPTTAKTIVEVNSASDVVLRRLSSPHWDALTLVGAVGACNLTGELLISGIENATIGQLGVAHVSTTLYVRQLTIEDVSVSCSRPRVRHASTFALEVSSPRR